MNGISTNGPVSESVASRGPATREPAATQPQQAEAAVPAPATSQPAPISRIDPLDKAAEVINELLTSDLGNSRLRIDRDENTGRFIYLSVDRTSGDVIKQFPPEQILSLLTFYRQPEGVALDQEV